jgi:hypothetical protein
MRQCNCCGRDIRTADVAKRYARCSSCRGGRCGKCNKVADSYPPPPAVDPTREARIVLYQRRAERREPLFGDAG